MRISLCLPALLLALSAVRADDVLDKAPSRFAKQGDAKVHYKSLGEGKTALVFVHGWCCNHTVWHNQATAFNGKFRMLFIDLPGYGKSDTPKVEYTMDLFAKGIDAVLQDAGVEHAIPVGHSMGVPVVRQYYRLFPGKTKTLVFVDGGLRSFFKEPAKAEQFLSRFKEDTFKIAAPAFLSSMFTAATPEAARKQIIQMVTNTEPRVAISSMRGIADAKIWDDDPIKAPSQVLNAKSRMWDDDYRAYVKKLVPDLDYREFEGVGHFLFMEKPKEFNAALSEFLTKQGMLK